MSKRSPVLIVVAILFAAVSVAQARAQYPYTLVDPGTFGGPQSFLNLPAIPLTAEGTLLGTADTTTPDADYENFNPFLVGLPDPYLVHAFAWQGGHLRDLGALPGNNGSAIFELNAHGAGVGMSEADTTDPFTGWPAAHAVMFKAGKVVDLGTLPGGHESFALAINDRGQVSGFGSNGVPDRFGSVFFGDDGAWHTQVRSFVWQNGTIHDIGTLGGPDALMNAANDRGEIAGQSFTSSTVNASTDAPTLDPFLWEKGRMRDLGTLGGTLGFGNWLNDRGEVVGSSDLAGDQAFHPFLWDGVRMTDLGTLGGDFGMANYVNERGDVAGWAGLRGDQTFHGVLWHNGNKVDLLPVGDAPWSFANAVNNHDQVVGNETNLGGSQELIAALWSGGRGYDLNTLVAPHPMQMTSGEYINDQGDIVGHGVLPNGDQRMFLLIRNPSVPLPSTSTPAEPQPTTAAPGTSSGALLAPGAAARGSAAAAAVHQLTLSLTR